MVFRAPATATAPSKDGTAAVPSAMPAAGRRRAMVMWCA